MTGLIDGAISPVVVSASRPAGALGAVGSGVVIGLSVLGYTWVRPTAAVLE
jgi:hypothetical protein